ncbi:MAG: deoxyribodipyrimidine photolyase [Bacteroidetes bacterium]|nr:deoxyribodipyrimidine photolyase [Bacteroidota bacterium]
MFPTNYSDILKLIDAIDPVQYGKTRNYMDGAVTKLSPYISRGIISTKQIAKAVLDKGYKPYEIEIFLKELAWRDYFQQVWIAKKNEIDKDLKQVQSNVSNHQIPAAVTAHQTGITAIDNAIAALYETGYMHNHLRMYVASLCCNVVQSHWHQPAQWMYYHLLDADWASNALSWQWTAGCFSSKKYYANQENINKYCHTHQQNTFLDVSYENIEDIVLPEELSTLTELALTTNLPEVAPLNIDDNLPFCIYNFYNMDCNWLTELNANRILLLEPDFFKKYPVSDKTIRFVLDLSKNIKNIQVFVGSFDDLFGMVAPEKIHFKEHPTNQHYKGIQYSRDWMFEEVTGYYPSFFSYWKKGEKYLK